MTIKKKTVTHGKTALTSNKKQSVSFRLDAETVKRISVIANNKKTSKTRVISELVRIAYIGLYSKPMVALNGIYLKLLKEDDERQQKNKKAKK